VRAKYIDVARWENLALVQLGFADWDTSPQNRRVKSPQEIGSCRKLETPS
jgi:hypothetical protein